MLRFVCMCARGGEEAVVASGAVLLALRVGGRYVRCWLEIVVRTDGGFVYGPGRLAACFPRARDRDRNREVTGITPPLGDGQPVGACLRCFALMAEAGREQE